MKKSISIVCAFVLLSSTSALAQHHMSGWVHRTATDTTVVQCWADSLTAIAFPPNSMNMMMMPDSIYCRIDRMPMDSLGFPHDSTFIGWFRVQAGSDSMHFDMMNGDSMHGSRNMMQFMKNLSCQFHWDSLMSDSTHRHWHPTGMMGWNGSGKWVSLGGSMGVNTVTFTGSQLYSGYAFIGSPAGVVSAADQQVIPGEFRLEQNFPNPFNPSTTIRYNLPTASHVVLSVYNTLGQQVATLVEGEMEAGDHGVKFDASHLASGVYLYRLQAGDLFQTRMLLLMK